MHGVPDRKTFEAHQARILEASGYPGPIGAGILSAAEKSRAVALAAEQRRLLREAGLAPSPDRPGFFARASSQLRRLVARIGAGRPRAEAPISSPDRA